MPTPLEGVSLAAFLIPILLSELLLSECCRLHYDYQKFLQIYEEFPIFASIDKKNSKKFGHIRKTPYLCPRILKLYI